MTRDKYYDALEHADHKYVEKWKSKSGNWVYKYTDSVKTKAQNAYNTANNITKKDTKNPGKDGAYIDKALFMMDYASANRSGQMKQAYAQRAKAETNPEKKKDYENLAEEYSSEMENDKRIGDSNKATYDYKLSEYKKSFPGKIDIAMKFVKNFFGR